MPILKNKTPGSFVMIGKDILKNTDLKLVDRGMLATLLSLPDKWDFSIIGLAKILPEGKSAIQTNRIFVVGKLCAEKSSYVGQSKSFDFESASSITTLRLPWILWL